MFQSLVLALVLATAHAAPAPTLDLAYLPPSDIAGAVARLDIHRPDTEAAAPLVVLVHGGSWVGGDKKNYASQAPRLVSWWLDRGYVVAAVNFRLATKPGVPAQVKPVDQARDIAQALAWLHANASQHGIDSTQGAVAVGFSSGAHLVALLGADGQYLEAAGLPETHLRATVSLDVHAYDVPLALQLMKGSVVERNMGHMQHLFGTTSAEQMVASPAGHVEGYVAPAFLVSVEPDPQKPGTHGYIVDQTAARYVALLQSKGHTAGRLHDSSRTHTSLVTGFGAPNDPVAAAVGTFLDTLPAR